jgi:OmpA-OmpF porin, OOP family
LAFLLSAGAIGTAHAQTAPTTAEGFSVNRFEPSERGSEWFYNESLDFRGKTRPAIGVVFDYMARPLAAYNSEDKVSSSIVRNVYTLHPGFSMVFFERLRFGASLPVVLFQDGGLKGGGTATTVGNTVFAAPKDAQAIGDLRLGLDFRLLGEYGDKFTLALGAQLFLPTGSRENYTGDGNVRISPRLMAAGDLGDIFAYSARVAFNYRNERVYGPGQDSTVGAIGSEFGYGIGAGVRVANKRLVIGPELWGSVGFAENASGRLSTPVEGLLGAHYTLPGDFRLGAGVGTGLTRGYGTPQVRVVAGLEWMPSVAKEAPPVVDTDGDGIPDTEDACASAKGPRTQDPRTNGCPVDTDGDGVLDDVDACVTVPGEKTADPRTNGCPADRDGDGIIDSQDACIDVPGVKSEDPKKNGCPADTDGDGILDKDDACPTVPGKSDPDPKKNGCPDPDRDKDGIENEKDACPDEPGKADPDPKKNGCPKAFVQNGLIRILDQVKFKTSSAQIEKSKDSQDVLEAVLDVLKKHPEIKGLRVEGHTDNKGIPAANKKLSQDRAASVVKWLVDKGMPKAMFQAQGFGQEKPIETNDTDAGRQANRRVEFHIQDGPTTITEPAKPGAAGTKPPAGGAKPPAGGAKPPAGGAKPPTPPKPPAGGAKPPTPPKKK